MVSEVLQISALQKGAVEMVRTDCVVQIQNQNGGERALPFKKKTKSILRFFTNFAVHLNPGTLFDRFPK